MLIYKEKRMKHLIKEAKDVADSFQHLIKAIHERSVFSKKQNELMLIGIFTADKALRNLQTHIKKALEHGATKDEIISAILLALPAIGINRVSEALSIAMEIIEE